MFDAINEFKSAIRSYGLEPPEVIDPGKFHRMPGLNKLRGNTAAWCMLFPDQLGGVFGDFSTALEEKWQSNKEKLLTSVELSQRNELLQEVKRKTQEEEVNKQKLAAQKAAAIWKDALSVSREHAYLINKQVQSHTLKLYEGDLSIGGMSCNQSLIVPIRQGKQLYSLQFINSEGEKRFLTGGRKKGGYFSLGKLKAEHSATLCIAEGFATGATIHEVTNNPVAVAFDSGNILEVACYFRKLFPDLQIIICADDDFSNTKNVGLSKAKEAAKRVNAKLAIPKFKGNRPEWAKDFNDLMKLEGFSAVEVSIQHTLSSIAKPESLPHPLPEAMSITPDMLPLPIRDYILDTCHRQQCPIDFVTVTTLVGLSAMVGNKIRVYPKQHDDWEVTPNLWGVIIGEPSTMKTPSMKAALSPIKKLDSKNAKQYEKEKNKYNDDLELFQLQKSAVASNTRQALKDGLSVEEARKLLNTGSAPEIPIRQRISVNDASVEKLGELLKENASGLLLVRDELLGLISRLSKEEYQAERAFYLECFDGSSSYTYDRIGRGTIEIKNCTLSVIGGIQPSRITKLVTSSVDGSQDDGFLQRFQLIA